MVNEVPTFDYSIEFQKRILSALVRDIKFLTEYGYDIINPAYFDNWYHQFICKNILRYFVQHREPPDQVSLETVVLDAAKMTQMDDEGINNLFDDIHEIFHMDLDNMGLIREKIISFVKRQNLIKGIDQVGDLLAKDEDYDKAVAIIEKAVHVGHSVDLGLNFGKSYRDIRKLYNEEYGLENLIKSPFPALNRVMGGGFYRNFLYVITAPPGRGKTSLLSNIAAHSMIKGHGVLYYTFEVPEVEIIFKVICAMTGMTHDDIISGDSELFEKRIQFFDKFSKNLQVMKFPGHTVSTHALRSHASRVQTVERFKPSLILVDYADYILPTMGSTDSSYNDRGDTYQDLLNLGEEYHVPVITASQPKVSAWDKPIIREEDLAESSKKAQLARGIITMNQNDDEAEAGKMRLYTAKMSKGVTGAVVPIAVDLPRCQFKELRTLEEE